MRRNIRVYPSCCTSAYCGKVRCPESCPSKPALDAFNEWVKQNRAQPSDPIWSPNVYVAQTV